MAYGAKILLDSISPAGCRLTTWELTYPRFIHSEFMTHREFSRNAASSRAIPVEKMIKSVFDDPAMPVYWGKNQKGMQAAEELAGAQREYAEAVWLNARDEAVAKVRQLLQLDVHKQIANRLLEPWMWITVIASSTSFSNLFHLRDHKDAQPEFRHLARMMRPIYDASTPSPLAVGEWHMPLLHDLDDEEMCLCSIDELKMISTGRCARVSYLTHDGKRDFNADIDLCGRLTASGHWSPFEHVAKAMSDPLRSGNFTGWFQYRKEFALEYVR